MDAEILTLLQSNNIEHRKQAIRLLVNDGSEEAIHQLALLYKSDPDPEIRDLAVKAGRYIKKTTQTLPALPPLPTEPKRTTGTLKSLKPATGSLTPPGEKPSTGSLKPPTTGEKTSTGTLRALKPPTGSLTPPGEKPSTGSLKPPTTGEKTSTGTLRALKPTTGSLKPPTTSEKPSTGSLKPPTSAQKPTTGSLQIKPVSDVRTTQTFERLIVEPKTPEPPSNFPVGDPTTSYTTSVANIDRAQGFLAAALVMIEQDKLKQAVANMRKALEADPNLQYDDDFKRLAVLATELPEGEALDKILYPEGKPVETETKGKKVKPKRNDYIPADGLRWSDVAVDIAAYGIVQAVLAFILFMVIANQTQPLSSTTRLNASFSAVGGFLPLYYAFINNIQIVIFVVAAAVVGVITIVRLLLDYVSMHIAATIFLLGMGSFKKLIRAMTLPYIAMEIAIFFLVVLPVIYTPPSANVLLGISCNSGMALFVTLFLFSIRVGQVYDFGVIRGCMTFILGAVVLGLMLGAIEGVFQALVVGVAGGV